MPARWARAVTPRGEVALRERRENGVRVLELRVNGVFVMDTLETSTERALAGRALDAAARTQTQTAGSVPALRVLVGGLGLGFTARELLDDPRVARVDVVEIEEPVVAWMRDGTIPHGPALLADDRLRVVVDDVRRFIGTTATAPESTYDLVLLDVDNGPGYLVYEANAEVYRAPFLVDVRRALRPGGVAAVWSADEAPELLDALRGVFSRAEEVSLPIRLQGREDRYVLYLATRDPDRSAG